MSVISTKNKSIKLLKSGEEFTGEAEEVNSYAYAQIIISSDVKGVCEVMQGTDSDEWDFFDTIEVEGYYAVSQNIPIKARYVLVNYKNTDTKNQTYFRLMTIYKNFCHQSILPTQQNYKKPEIPRFKFENDQTVIIKQDLTKKYDKHELYFTDHTDGQMLVSENPINVKKIIISNVSGFEQFTHFYNSSSATLKEDKPIISFCSTNQNVVEHNFDHPLVFDKGLVIYTNRETSPTTLNKRCMSKTMITIIYYNEKTN